MTTERQLVANRKNSKSSTGPRTEDGKRRSRRNAMRHGLMAETVIDVLEDSTAYKQLATKINSDYRPGSNFERELVARLISLLWRLRRAVAIESGLFAIERAAHATRKTSAERERTKLRDFYGIISGLSSRMQREPPSNPEMPDRGNIGSTSKTEVASYFIPVACDKDAFERLGRYEVRLWRQMIQTILLLNSINHRTNVYADHFHGRVSLRNRSKKHPHAVWPPFYARE